MVLVQPASPPPPVVPPPLVLPPVPVTPPVEPADIEAPVEPPLVLPVLPPEDPAVDELVPLPPVDVELPDVAVVDPLVAEPPVLHAALLAYSQTPLAPHTPLGQSLPESQARNTHGGGSVGHPPSKRATMTRGSDFTM
jgi:hypothetical protein